MYKMEITENSGSVIVSPVIEPNSNKSGFGRNDRRIEREIKKTGKSMVSKKIIKSFKVISI